MAKQICVYLNGTDEPARFHDSQITSLANLLHHLTVQDENTESICLDGCGINNPWVRDLGAIFTWNLEGQVSEIAKEIRVKASAEKIVLNIYGFSRGGAGAFWLASKLKDVPAEQLEINILPFEAVPGNFINNVYFDKALALDATLSSQIADLSDCQNIRRVYSLYTNIPLPDIACHGPILPALPAGCEHKVDIVPGCHKGSELFRVREPNMLSPKYQIEAYNDESAIAFHQAVKFLQECGTKLNFDRFSLDRLLKEDAPLQKMYDNKVAELICQNDEHIGIGAPSKPQSTTRAMHFSNSIYARPTPDKRYLNLFHQCLANVPANPKACILFMEDSDPRPSISNGQKSAANYIYPALLLSAAAYVWFKSLAKKGPSL